jgi:hypothetical protein
VSIKFRKQSAAAVPTPEGPYIQLFVDVDGQPKVKDNAGQVIPLAQASTLTLTEQPTAPEPAPDTIKLYAKDVAGKTELFIKDGTGAEIQVTSDGAVAGASGGVMPHPGLFGNPAIGEFAASEGDLVTLPSGAKVGDRAGVFALEASDVRPPSGQILLWGISTVTGPATITLKAGAYAEWVYCELEPDIFGWLPSGASNEEPAGAPLAYRGSGDPVLPNEWVLSSDHDDEVSLPVAPQNGDSFAVFVDTEGCALTAAPGVDLFTADGANHVTGPTPLNVPGVSYYEWIWNEVDQQWFPRQNVLHLRSDAVLQAIVSAPTSIIDFGSRYLGSVLAPTASDQAATKGYVDNLVLPYDQTKVTVPGIILPAGGGVVSFFTFSGLAPLTEYAFQFELTINQANAPAFVSVGLSADVFAFTENIALVRNVTASTFAVSYASYSQQGNSLLDDAIRQPGNCAATIRGGLRTSNAANPGPITLQVGSTAGQTGILAGSWGRVWKAN